MHDPRTLVFSIRNPFGSSSLIDIWHRDPCKDGNDDSCDWFGTRRPLNKKEKELSEAIRDLGSILGNPPFYPDSESYKRYERLSRARWRWLERRKLRWHPRWHFWHWRVVIRPVQTFKRWLFTRCSVCGGRFKWGESGIGTWDSEGPRWFKSETLAHFECHRKYHKDYEQF